MRFGKKLETIIQYIFCIDNSLMYLLVTYTVDFNKDDMLVSRVVNGRVVTIVLRVMSASLYFTK